MARLESRLHNLSPKRDREPDLRRVGKIAGRAGPGRAGPEVAARRPEAGSGRKF